MIFTLFTPKTLLLVGGLGVLFASLAFNVPILAAAGATMCFLAIVMRDE